MTAETPCAVLIRAELPFENPLVRTPPPRPFWYWDKGDLAIAGRMYALANLRMLRFTGFPAWVVWAVVHIYFLMGFANRSFVMLQWVLTFLTKRRQVRVFPGQERPFDSARGLAHDYASRSHPK